MDGYNLQQCFQAIRQANELRTINPGVTIPFTHVIICMSPKLGVTMELTFSNRVGREHEYGATLPEAGT